MRQFFKYSHGSVSITGSDMFSDSWAGNPSSGTPFVTAQNIAWSQLESVTVISPGGGKPSPGLALFYRGVLSLAPGKYTLRQTFSMERPVQDRVWLLQWRSAAQHLHLYGDRIRRIGRHDWR